MFVSAQADSFCLWIHVWNSKVCQTAKDIHIPLLVSRLDLFGESEKTELPEKKQRNCFFTLNYCHWYQNRKENALGAHYTYFLLERVR